MKLKTYMAEHKIKHNALALQINRTRMTVHNLIKDNCIVIDDKIYKPVYDLEQLAESKSK